MFGPVQLKVEPAVMVDEVKLMGLPTHTGLLLPAVGVLGNGLLGIRFRYRVSLIPEQLPVPIASNRIKVESVNTPVDEPRVVDKVCPESEIQVQL